MPNNMTSVKSTTAGTTILSRSLPVSMMQIPHESTPQTSHQKTENRTTSVIPRTTGRPTTPSSMLRTGSPPTNPEMPQAGSPPTYPEMPQAGSPPTYPEMPQAGSPPTYPEMPQAGSPTTLSTAQLGSPTNRSSHRTRSFATSETLRTGSPRSRSTSRERSPTNSDLAQTGSSTTFTIMPQTGSPTTCSTPQTGRPVTHITHQTGSCTASEMPQTGSSTPSTTTPQTGSPTTCSTPQTGRPVTHITHQTGSCTASEMPQTGSSTPSTITPRTGSLTTSSKLHPTGSPSPQSTHQTGTPCTTIATTTTTTTTATSGRPPSTTTERRRAEKKPSFLSPPSSFNTTNLSTSSSSRPPHLPLQLPSRLVLFFLLLRTAACLAPGHHPPYDSLCISNAPSIAAPWDCGGYIRCQQDATTGTSKAVWEVCAAGKKYDHQAGQCVSGYTGCEAPSAVANAYCKDFPDLVFGHPGSCALSYNCRQTTTRDALGKYEAECPYPQLFDLDTLTCISRPSGADLTNLCGARSAPSTTCDYRKGCSATSQCQGQADGDYADRKRPFSEHYVICQNGAVLREAKCDRTGQVFDPMLMQCIFGIRDDSIATFCNKNPTAVFPDPYHCARHFDCSQVTWLKGLRAKQSECRYPLLYDVNTTMCTSFDVVTCGNREEPIQPCDYMIGHCLDREECIPCQASCLGLPNGFNAYPGHVLTAYHILCDDGRTVDILNCTTGLVFDPQLRTCSTEISLQTLDLFCSENPDGKLPHPSECSLLYDCTHLTAKPNFPKYLSECKYPYLVDDTTVQCKPHDQVTCGDRRESISPCDYLGYKCTSAHCKSCELVMPSCYGKLNGFYPVINQEMTSSYMECQDQRVVALSSCPGGLIFDIIDRKCVDTVSEVSMIQYCTNSLTGRVQSPTNCAQYYDCTKNLTAVQECRYPDLYHVTLQECRHYSEVECKGRRAFLDPCDSFTFCPVSPCPYCPTAFPTCIGRNGVINGFIFDDQLYYRCIDNRMILGRCLSSFDRDKKRCNDSGVITTTTTTTPTTTTVIIDTTTTTTPTTTTVTTTTPETTTTTTPTTTTTTTTTTPPPPTTTTTTPTTTTTTTTAPPTTTTTTPTTTTTKATTTTTRKTTTTTSTPYPRPFDINTTCMKDPGFIAPKGDNCAQFYNCSNGASRLGRYVSECPIGHLFNAATGLCAPHFLVRCYNRWAPQQACHYAVLQCQYAPKSSGCAPCQERFPNCWGRSNGPWALPRQLSSVYITCRYGRVARMHECPRGQFLDPRHRRCTAELSLNTSLHFCMNHPNTLSSHPLHCARYILCKNMGTPPRLGECPYPKLFTNGKCLDFSQVQCGSRYEPKAPCEYSSLRQCRDKNRAGCAICEERFPSCKGKPDGNQPYPGRMFTPWFVRCKTERTLAVVRCVKSLFDPMTRKCGFNLDQIVAGVVSSPAQFCRQYPNAVMADPLQCARFYNCSSPYPGLLGRPHLSECRFPSLFNRHTLQCDSFVSVMRSVGCGRSQQPLHQCEYASYCPGARYRTCQECYNNVPSCRGISDGIHTIPPGRHVSRAFMYCLDQRSLVYSHCPHDFLYHDAAKTCVRRSSVLLSPYILAAVTEPPEV